MSKLRVSFSQIHIWFHLINPKKILSDIKILEKIAALSELSDLQFFHFNEIKPEAPAIKLFRTDGTTVALNSLQDLGSHKLIHSLYSWIYDNRVPDGSQIKNLTKLNESAYYIILVLSKESSTPESERSLFSLFKQTETELREFRSTKRNGFFKEREELENQLAGIKQTLAHDENIREQRIAIKKKIVATDLKLDHIRRDWIFHWLYKEDNLEDLPLWGLEAATFPTWMVYHNYTFWPASEPLTPTTSSKDIIQPFLAAVANKTIPHYFSEEFSKKLDWAVLKDPVFKLTGKSIRFYVNPVRWPYIDDWGVPSDIFLLAYSSKSPELSDRLLQLWKRLAQRLSEVNHILVAKIDLAQNWAPFSRERIPRVIFYPAHTKQDPVEYFGEFHLEDLVNFAKNETSFRGLLRWKAQYPDSAREEDYKLEQELSFRTVETTNTREEL